jgi:hypothetical protein
MQTCRRAFLVESMGFCVGDFDGDTLAHAVMKRLLAIRAKSLARMGRRSYTCASARSTESNNWSS